LHLLIHMGVDPWMDRGTCPLTFRSGGDALCFVPYFFGSRHVCTNAQLHIALITFTVLHRSFRLLVAPTYLSGFR